MGKHVPSGNLFPTVRTRRPTEQREYLSTERVCSTYRSIDRPTVRYDACTVLLPMWSFLMDTKLVCSSMNEITRTTDAGITLPPTIDRAAMPTIYYDLTTTVPIRLQSHRPDNDSADMPAIYQSIDRPSSTLDPLSSPDACTVLLPEQTAVSPAAVDPLLLFLQHVRFDRCCSACSVPPTTAAPACSMT